MMFDEYRLSCYIEFGDFFIGVYNFSFIENGIIFECDGSVVKRLVCVEKLVRFIEDGFIVDYIVRSDVRVFFGVEFNLVVYSVMEELVEFEVEKFEVNDFYGIGKVEIEFDRSEGVV